MDRLGAAVDRLYAVFRGTPKPQSINGCPCFLDDKDIDKLLKTDLREISAKDLSPDAASAFSTVSDVADYLYFLPRILEISATEISWWPSVEVTARAIRSTNFESWTSAQQDALIDFLGAVLESEIGAHRFTSIDGWMCAIARLGLDVHPYLDIISELPDAVLSHFEDNARCLSEGRLCNPFWELPSRQHDAIVEWFRSEAICRIPFEAYGYQF